MLTITAASDGDVLGVELVATTPSLIEDVRRASGELLILRKAPIWPIDAALVKMSWYRASFGTQPLDMPVYDTSAETIRAKMSGKSDQGGWGKGVSKAVANIAKTIAPELLGKDAFDSTRPRYVIVDLPRQIPQFGRRRLDASPEHAAGAHLLQVVLERFDGLGHLGFGVLLDVGDRHGDDSWVRRGPACPRPRRARRA